MYKAEIWRGTELLGGCSCDLDNLGFPYAIAPDIAVPDGLYLVRYGDLAVPVRLEAGQWQRVRRRGRRGDTQRPAREQ